MVSVCLRTAVEEAASEGKEDIESPEGDAVGSRLETVEREEVEVQKGEAWKEVSQVKLQDEDWDNVEILGQTKSRGQD